MHDPKAGHMEVVYRILRYLKGTPGRGLWFRKNGHLDVEGYYDAEQYCLMEKQEASSCGSVYCGG